MSFNLHATPKSVEDLFTKNTYCIPEYQRPYSWGVDECATLWNDILQHFESSRGSEKEQDNEDGYFLGSIVLVGKSETGHFEVVDGQQRLITLSILLRVFYERVKTLIDLRRCLYALAKGEENKRDEDLNKDPEQLIRITSCVLGELKNNERACLTNALSWEKWIEMDALAKSRNNYAQNWKYFEEQVWNYIGDSANTEEAAGPLITHILEKLVILPIRTGEEDKALEIFATINDRGMALSEADRFKAHLYKIASKAGEASEFTEKWAELSKGTSDSLDPLAKTKTVELGLVNLFRWYANLLCAKDNIGSPTNLYKFFTEGLVVAKSGKTPEHKDEKYKLESLSREGWQNVMNSLKRFKDAWIILSTGKHPGLNKKYPEIKHWHDTLAVRNKNLVTSTATSAAVIYVYKCLEKIEKANEGFSPEVEGNCVKFLYNMTRYVVAKAFDNSLDEKKLEDELRVISFKAAKLDKYEPEINITDALKDRLDKPLPSNGIFPRMFCRILELTNPKWEEGTVTVEDLMKRDIAGAEIEHILPKNQRVWKEYYPEWDKYDADEANAAVKKLGNLVLLEEDINRSAWFWGFDKKQQGGETKRGKESAGYKASDLAEVEDLLKLPQWTPAEFENRHKKNKEHLMKFFNGELKK